MEHHPPIDLWFNPDEVRADFTVNCERSPGVPSDERFGPLPGDRVWVDDGSGAPLRAVVVAVDTSVVNVWLVQPDPSYVAALGVVLRDVAGESSD